ncbi:CocE/NonD family hydrolase [Mycolicibacterium septicum]|uniref:CocE/NonD family hydrolase n=1 Tax=Mycolicibacterium septicum TaxID=98668 RepID=UPI00236211C5|nr:CocE/NonD family hydrolase [Mycolicibacterium septicum]
MTEPEVTEVRSVRGEDIEVVLRKAAPIDEEAALEPGQSIADGIVYDRDVAVVLRDGTTIYTDVYRPEGATNLPAIIAWSPYGKRAGYAGKNFMPGVPLGTFSDMTKAEGPDPAYWCYHGYAVINPDARGAGSSEGTIQVFTSQEGRDGADLVEWVAAQEWSNGKVGMSGNSWLAVTQWFIAAEQPPHLTCIAPWDGFVDTYDALYCGGGIPEIGFTGMINNMLQGVGNLEDAVTMNRKHPFKDVYWQDKVAAMDKVEIPVYVCAGWTNPLHAKGSIEGFRRMAGDEKWLRAHRNFEWPDYYTSENLEDLRRFFDRYLKGIRNGWELTPPVRIDVVDAGEINYQSERGETDFPLERTVYKQLFLDAENNTLTPSPPEKEAAVAYKADDGLVTFDLTFDQITELTGYMKLRLWVEARDADDMDLFVAVQKTDAEGTFVPVDYLGFPHAGALGLLRVSHRELDEKRSTPFAPVTAHLNEQLLEPGQIVPVDIAIWPSSRVWFPGERLRVVVGGRRDPAWFLPFAWELRNRGEHVIHAGGKYDSHLLVPVIPGRGATIPGAAQVEAGARLFGQFLD